MPPFARDLRQAFRMLFNRPAFSAAAIAILALGIGANTAIFSLVNAFLFKPLVIHNPQDVVGCFSRDTRKPDYRGFSYPNYADLRASNQAFSSLAAHNPEMVGIKEGETTRRVFADAVSSNYFETLGVPLFRGRTFSADEERPGSQIASAVMSYSYWKRSGEPALGQSLRINGRAFTLVGIAPEGFTGTTAVISSDLYLPLGMHELVNNDFNGRGGLASRGYNPLLLFGRLRPGLTTRTATPLLAAAADRLGQDYPGENRYQTFLASPLSRTSISTEPGSGKDMAVPAALLLSMTAVVLLIASLNVANMMLARGTARRKEIAIRLALGGSRGDILRQLLAEGLVLALMGGAAGLLLAFWGSTALVDSMRQMAPVDLVFQAGPDGRVLAATLGFCLMSTLLFSLGPGWRLARRAILGGLKDGPEMDSAGKPRRLFSRRNVLVLGQLALSLMLLTAAGLFLRSTLATSRMEPGFDTANAVLAEVDASLGGRDEAQGRKTYALLLDRLKNIPGVESASIAATVPFGMVSLGRSVRTAPNATPVGCRSNIVSESYFRTMGIRLLRGRYFAPTEATAGGPRVAILDKYAAARLWPGGDAIGKQLVMKVGEGGTADETAQVVGVVAPVQERLFEQEASPHIYVPFGQEYQSDMTFHLRVSDASPAGEARVLEEVRRQIQAADDRLPLLALRTLRAHLYASAEFWLVRTGTQLFLIFGCVALLLAMIGLYGVQAYAVALRTREIGIRMALGATSTDSLRMVLREGMLLTAIGTAVGLVLSLGMGKVLASLLYRVSAADPMVMLTAPLLLAAVSLVSCYIPARRASRIDPMIALRYE